MAKKRKRNKSNANKQPPAKKQPNQTAAATGPVTPKNEERRITHLIRIEAINIDAIYDDTDAISIRRGGGLLIRQAVIDAQDWLVEYLTSDRVERISVGASIGTYGLKLQDQDLDEIIEYVAGRLNRHKHYQLACFAIALSPYDNDYSLAREKLLAQIRYQQLQQPSCYVPPPSEKHHGVCDFDHVSPGSRDTVRGERKYIGDSARLRFDYGRNQRQKFYRDELEGFEGLKDSAAIDFERLSFTDDLHELSDNPDFGNLSGKIALIYFDGNGFSSEQRDHCRTIPAQRGFDRSVQAKRRAFLADLIARAADDDTFKTKEGRLRLEILLWGGDEFLLVVPAWKGWEVAQGFLNRHAPEFSFPTDRGGSRRLTHAGGLVFCGAKTPIVRIRHLAAELADTIKANKANKDRNTFAYLVLESIEYPTGDIDDYFQQRYGLVASDNTPLLASMIEDDTLGRLLKTVSSRILHSLGTVLARHGPDSLAYQDQWERTKEILGAEQLQDVEAALDALFPNQKKTPHWQWLHLLELRDYLAPKPGSTAVRKGLAA